MNSYIEQLKQALAEYDAKCGCEGPDSVLELLWYCYSASCPVDDGHIRDAEDRLAPVIGELSLISSDILFDLIAELCTAYQRAAYLEGLKTGVHLVSELRLN